MAQKVLIVYGSGGMGHVTAAKAIEEVFKTKYPHLILANVDIFSFAWGWFHRAVVDGYNYISAQWPQFWGFLYRIFNKSSRHGPLNFLGRLGIMRRFIDYIQEFQPDFIVTTHPLPARLIAASKKQHLIDIPSSLVVTDFGCHSFWVDPNINYYFTATAGVKMCLQNYAVPAEKIFVSGIPIEAKFSQTLDRLAVVKKTGLKSESATILIIGGQFSFDQLKTIIHGIQRQNSAVQFLVVAGRDKFLKADLDQSDLVHNPQVKVYGFVSHMHELMTAADIIFSKAGGLTVSECMAKGLPMVINKVIPGQEEDNVDFLVAQGAAVKADGVPGIIEVLTKLLADPKKLEAMKAACRRIGQPRAAENIADFVYQKLTGQKNG